MDIITITMTSLVRLKSTIFTDQCDSFAKNFGRYMCARPYSWAEIEIIHLLHY